MALYLSLYLVCTVPCAKIWHIAGAVQHAPGLQHINQQEATHLPHFLKVQNDSEDQQSGDSTSSFQPTTQ